MNAAPFRLFLLLLVMVQSLFAADEYELTAASKPQEGVPKGEVLKFSFDQSKIFPGTTREYWIYIPRQYDPAKPACLYVNQDGVQFNAPTVFDNLIAAGEMPVTIGVFVMHGRVPALDPAKALDRFNRSYEYDGLGDHYVRFLTEELLPDVEKKTATDGRPIILSKDGNDRAIGGSSSGAIAAFTAAWERPSAFSRVFSSIGTYVGLRGGNEYMTLIRKFEPKPLRIFLQDGSADLNIYAGDWWMVNQEMERALTFAGYEVQHVWGEGGHNGKHASAIFPDAMRFLWKGWPEPVKAGQSRNGMLKELLIPGEEWQLVGDGYKFTEGPASNMQGEVFFNDVPNSKTYKVTHDGTVSEFLPNTLKGDGQAFGPDGRLYQVAGGEQRILAYNPNGLADVIADRLKGVDISVRSDQLVYVTEPSADPSKPGQIWSITPHGEKKVVDTGLKLPNGIAFSPDQSLLYVADTRSHWVYSYQVQPDGALAYKQAYYWLHSPDNADESGADGLAVDQAGRLYVATRMGIQVCDQAGRVNCIIPTPNGNVSNITFGGNKFGTLFATCGDRVYRRKLNTAGAQSYLAPIKPKPPGL
ncbi:MAG TPA: SMP-30/gluconolactonase/LRE family protein [Chthoniobacteraceae bacterium]|jgi:sugar lactone lactonase YvrE/enterochelin esterase-like enzyme